MPTWMRLLALLMAALALAAAVAQLDDPDAWHWVAGYAVAALASVLFVARVLPKSAAWFLGGLYAGWLIAIAVRFVPSGAEWNPEGQFLAEEVREMGGLAIFGTWTVIMAAIAPKKPPAR